MLTDEFKREPRYIVIKRTDLDRLSYTQRMTIEFHAAELARRRAEAGKPPLDCVVVESDWPEFEPTWAAIEARMTGRAIEAEVAAQQGNAPAVEGLEVVAYETTAGRLYPLRGRHDDKPLVRQSDAAAIIAKLEAQISATERLVVAGLRAEAERLTAELAALKNTAAGLGDIVNAKTADLAESDAIRERCARLLAETAVALKGPEKALHRHGWQDLPEVAAKMAGALGKSREALTTVVERPRAYEATRMATLAIAAIDALGEKGGA